MATLERIVALEANSAWRGISRRIMMENAGAQVVREIWSRNPPEGRLAVFAGTGNNGGDGFVVARHAINRGKDVDLVLLGKPRNIASKNAQENWDVLSQMDENVDFKVIRDSRNLDDFGELEADVLIDAMLGTGISGGLREPVASAVDFINNQDAFKVAVDVPTGLDPSTGEVQDKAVKCDLTVTFHDTKPGLEIDEGGCTGELVTADIGIPKSAELYAGPGDVEMAIPPRGIGSHKGQNGRVLVVGGGSQYAGAPALTALASLNAGADLATVAAPEGTAEIINSFSPDLITIRLSGQNLVPESVPELKEALGKTTALLIGPGLGTTEETKEAVIELLEAVVSDRPRLPVVLDADGLKVASERPDILREGSFVLTPHTGEFEILTGEKLSDEESEKRQMVLQVAKDLETTIILKGRIDICAGSDGSIVLNDTGNPGMTVGGTGDVLAGVIGSFLSRGSDPLIAASAGAFLNGLAGDLCYQNKRYEFVASDVKDRIPIAIAKAREYW